MHHNLASKAVQLDPFELARCEIADAYHWFSGPEIRELAIAAQRIVTARARSVVQAPASPPFVTDHCVYLD